MKWVGNDKCKNFSKSLYNNKMILFSSPSRPPNMSHHCYLLSAYGTLSSASLPLLCLSLRASFIDDKSYESNHYVKQREPKFKRVASFFF